jgi:hypothetical protein
MGERIDDLEKSIADLVQEAQNDSDVQASGLANPQKAAPGGVQMMQNR